MSRSKKKLKKLVDKNCQVCYIETVIITVIKKTNK